MFHKIIYYKGGVITLFITLNIGYAKYNVYQDPLDSTQTFSMKVKGGESTIGKLVRVDSVAEHRLQMNIDGKREWSDRVENKELVEIVNLIEADGKKTLDRKHVPKVEAQLFELGFRPVLIEKR